jgi:predicted nucleic acid-binding protein
VGTLALPTSGSIYLDTNTLIYRVEMIEPYYNVAKPLWDALDASLQDVVTSELSLLEVLVKPLRIGDTTLQTMFIGTLYGTPGLSCVSITRQILEIAASLRATTGLKTPDAIHAATALAAGCTLFVTNDLAFRRVPGLNVAVLSEIAAAP